MSRLPHPASAWPQLARESCAPCAPWPSPSPGGCFTDCPAAYPDGGKLQPLRLQTPAGPEESRRGAQRGAPHPRVPRSSRAPAHPPSPTVPSFSPQVLKLSLRGDTAAAAALLPLLCLPMDMHCKADPFSAMHREYRRPAPVSVPIPSSPSAARPPALRSHPRGHTGFSSAPPFAPCLFLLPSVSPVFSYSVFCFLTPHAYRSVCLCTFASAPPAFAPSTCSSLPRGICSPGPRSEPPTTP